MSRNKLIEIFVSRNWDLLNEVKRIIFLFSIIVMATFSCETLQEQGHSNKFSECIGNSSAEKFLIYLHGMDASTPSSQELKNRKQLLLIANELNIRIALPRAIKPCLGQPQSICWSWNHSKEEMTASAEIVEQSANSCFPLGARYGLLGFSNGAYLLSAVYRNCKLADIFPSADWVVLVGGSKMKGSIGPVPSSLKNCGSMSILNGDQDGFNADIDRNYYQQLIQKGADVKEIFYKGGHELPYKELRDLLMQRFKKAK